MKDAIIIGVGPCGISSALYLNQLNKDVLVLGKDLGQLTEDDLIANFYSHLPTSGQSIILQGIHHAQSMGIKIVMEAVLDVEKKEDFFEVRTTKDTYQAKTVVLATGKYRIPLRVRGFNQFKGKGVHFCATCDAYFYKKKRIGLIGTGPYMEQELSILENFTDEIIIFTEGDTYTHPTYQTINQKIKSLHGEKRLEYVETQTDKIALNGLFVALDFPAASELAYKLGVIMDGTNIEVDDSMQTNIKGLFAGGDCIGGKLQIAKAVYDGTKISDGIIKYLRELSKHGNNQS